MTVTSFNREVKPKRYFMDEFDTYYPPSPNNKKKVQSATKKMKKAKLIIRRRQPAPIVKPRRVVRRLFHAAPPAAAIVNHVAAPAILPAPVPFVAPAPFVPLAAAAAPLGAFELIPPELLDESAWKPSDNLDDGIFRFPACLRADSPADPSLEICFSFDTTGSMSCYVDEVKRTVELLTRQLTGDLPDIRISIIAHGDYCDFRKFVLKRLDLSNDVQALSHFIKEVEETFGGDRDECYELVLREAQNLSWSATSAKALVVIGDASPHQPHEYRKINWEQEVEVLKAMGVKIYSVRCGGSKDAFYQEIANRTGGTTLESSKFNEIVEIMMGLCYREAAEKMGRERRMQSELEHHQDDQQQQQADAMNIDGQNNDVVARIIELPEQQQGEVANADEIILTEGDVMNIHFAIHTAQAEVILNGQQHEIAVGKAGCRFVKIGTQTFIEQNKDKMGSKYAQMALEGRWITWIIRKGKWGLIIGERLQEDVQENLAIKESGIN
jgi:hypothetical protein